MILFTEITKSRAGEWALYPDAPRGYLAGEQDPDEAAGVGLLTVNATPGAREIEVRHRLTRTVVATTFSTTAGGWRVDDLPSLDEYDVIARDHAAVWQDVIVAAQLPYV